MSKKLLTENDVLTFFREGSRIIVIDKKTILTPAAKDKINELSLRIEFSNDVNLQKIDNSFTVNSIAIGSDHTGFKVKSEIKLFLESKGISIFDVGTMTEQSCDYPDFADAVAKKVIENKVDMGIVIDATGIPSSIAANKIRGIRAATCYNEFCSFSARSHNDANVLVLGARTLGIEVIKSIINKWLETSFEGGRHQKRLDKISQIEDESAKRFNDLTKIVK